MKRVTYYVRHDTEQYDFSESKDILYLPGPVEPCNIYFPRVTSQTP